MTKRTGVVTLKGNPITLVGPELTVGSTAPDFSLKAIDMSDKTLADFAGKIKLISIVPSLDTPTCDTQTRRFNEEAGKLGDNIVVLTISVDLPPAMKRWCGGAGVESVVCLSDYKDHTFGVDYGVRIDEIGLLSRTIFVVDQDNVIRYIERVTEVTQEPDYDQALEAVKTLQPALQE